ncbi:lactonase family protein [Streptomyces pristinaespiralis]|uniref:Secreted protein n=1 Tax=Streptomyces pristinaespiralis TaxID=38300 RepID=A0A0M3QHR8_STRPR|nr:lactonase family protein [Streptomyces pristinaespiralis]ALC20003.1 secreted protein [Streptomyces pristinaespiralis]
MGISTGTGSESGTGRDVVKGGAAHVGRRRFLGGLGALAAGGALSACSRAGESAPRARSRVATTSTARPRTARPLFIGTYTSAEGGGPGIATATYDGTSGRITGTGVVEGVGDPSYLAVHPSGRTLYAVDERDAGAVTAVRLDAGGAHQVIGSRPTGGPAPCHLSVHPSGRWLLSANYGSGSVAVHPLAASGAPGERTDLVTHSEPPPGPGRSGPHAHQIVTSPDGGHVLAVDLGNDTVYTYRLDTRAGTLAEVSRTTLKPGAGPRHLTFHPSGRYAYVANELDNTVVVCAYDPRTGRLRPGAPQPTGTGSGTSYPAQLVVTGDGGYAYLANRGHNSLTRYAVEAGGSRLRLLDTVPVGGDFPRHIALSPSGGLLFAANQRSSTVTVFHVDRRTGELRSAGPAFGSPVAVCALPL